MAQTKEGFFRHLDGTMGAYYGGAEPPEGSIYIGLELPPTPEQLEAEATRQKAISLANIKVKVNDKEFDGHAEARSNMGHAIMLAGITNQTTIDWKLADNTIATVTLADLQQALLLSLTKYGEIIGAV